MMEEYPEYFKVFPHNGDIFVEVKFKDHNGTVSTSKMKAKHIENIINPATDHFYTEMRFDDWLFEVYKYEIDPIKKKLTIRARPKKGEA